MSVILNFVDSLRFFGLPISPSETITAQQVYEYLGTVNKQVLRMGLRTAILKRYEDFKIFDTCFDQFFTLKGSKTVENSPESESFLNSMNRSPNRNDAKIAELLVNDQIGEAVQTAMMMTPTGGGTTGGLSTEQNQVFLEICILLLI